MKMVKFSHPVFYTILVNVLVWGFLIGFIYGRIEANKEIAILETHLDNFKSNALEFKAEREKLEVLIEKLLEYMHEVKRASEVE